MLLCYDNRGYAVSSRVNLSQILPTVSEMQAPFYISAGVTVPNVDPALSGFVVPVGGVVLSYTGHSNVIAGFDWYSLPNEVLDVIETLLSMQVYAYYRVFGSVHPSVEDTIRASPGGRNIRGTYFPPPTGIFTSYGPGVVAECDVNEGCCMRSDYLWLINWLPTIANDRIHPYDYEGLWYPPNEPQERGHLWTRPASEYIDGILSHYVWIVTHPDAELDGQGNIVPVAWPGTFTSADGYLLSLTDTLSLSLPLYGGEVSTVGGYGSRINPSGTIREAVSPSGLGRLSDPLYSVPLVPPDEAVGVSARRPLARYVPSYLEGRGFYGRVFKLPASAVSIPLLDELYQPILDENYEVILP